MPIDLAIRLGEGLLAWALVLQSFELWRGGLLPGLGLVRLLLAAALLGCSLFSINPLWIETGLVATSLYLVGRYRGPYNGGSDTMTLLVLFSLCCARLAPTPFWREMALGYLALQLIWSYFQAGWVKVVNSEWRSGQALQKVFSVSTYPVSESTRGWAQRPRLLRLMGWLVILLELAFPLALLNKFLLIVALTFTLCFHLANAWLFGLNRFFWIWPAAYPALLWFQHRLMAMA